jgi:hypothetical protein
MKLHESKMPTAVEGVSKVDGLLVDFRMFVNLGNPR